MPSFAFSAGVLGLVLFAQTSFPIPELIGGWRTSGPVLYQVNAVAVEPSDDDAVYAAGSIYDASQSALFRSGDGGTSWEPLVEAPRGEFYSQILVDPRQPDRIYAGALGSAGSSHIYRSVDGGETWTLTRTIVPSGAFSFVPGSTPDAVLAACGSKVFRSQDAGATWTELATPFLVPVRLALVRTGTVLAYEAATIFRSTNDGGSWTSIASAPAACPGILALKVDPTDDGVFVAGAGKIGTGGFQCGGVFVSTDSGKTWGDNALPDFYVTDVVIDLKSPSTVFAAASFLSGILPRGGVFMSRDGGGTWTNLFLPASGAARLALSPSGRLLHAATSIGVFDRGFRRTMVVAPR